MSKFKKKIKGQKLTSAQLKKELTRYFKRQPKKRMTAKQFIKKMKLANSKDSVYDAMKKLAKDGILYEIEEGRFRLDRFVESSKDARRKKLFTGKVDLTRSGAAYVVCEGLEDDVYVAAKHTAGAFHGDIVSVSVHKARGRRKPEGEIVKVLKRAVENVMGRLRVHKNFSIVIPNNPRMSELEIMVKPDDLNGAEHDDIVVVKILDWGKKSRQNPIGKITVILGEEGSADIAMKSILINNGFDLIFPEEVLRESEQLTDEISEAEVAKRRDMRDVTTFTIDPDTARDFDDALSYRVLEDGRKEVGIHIADVTHFVRPKTALDNEAFARSTSVYLVDRVSPMLPEKISNELCSLRPFEDKCTFSAVFIFNEKNKIEERWFGKTLTHSNRRFTYEEAQEVIETGEGDFATEILALQKIAVKLRKDKFKNGAISFESPEVKFKLNEEGEPIDVYVKERKEANMLIEDFMLLANREVATFIAKQKPEIPYVYRVHDEPNIEKIGEFARFAKELGFDMKFQTPQEIADSFARLEVEAQKNEALKMLQPIAIRTMAKAIYTTENVGHYGLSFENYAHFTSPIRRYADVLVHRLLEKNLERPFRTDKEKLEIKCKHISAQERKAMDAERESIKYKQVEYTAKFIGEVFDAHISGMIDRGIFVQIDHSHAEGLIGFEHFDESYTIGEGRLKAVGNRSGKTLSMGQEVKARILDVDMEKRTIDMELVE